MKTRYLLPLILLVAGCYTEVMYNPVTQVVAYKSWGGRTFDKLEILILDDGSAIVEITNYDKEGIGPIAAGIAEGVVRGMKP